MNSGKLIRPQPEWNEFLQAVTSSAGIESVYICGGIDSGKTSFCHYCVNYLSRNLSVAYVNCDPGQASIGLPGTVGMVVYTTAPQKPLLRFVGSNSPSGHFLQLMTGTLRLARAALERGAKKIFFDSCGLISGRVAEEFHFRMVEALEAQHLVVFQKQQEAEPIIRQFGSGFPIRIWRFCPSPFVEERSIEQRRNYRNTRFKEYFRDAVEQTINVQGTGFQGDIPEFTNNELLRGIFVAACDKDGFILAIGILKEIYENNMVIFAPPFDHQAIVSIQFGTLRLKSSGEEEYL